MRLQPLHKIEKGFYIMYVVYFSSTGNTEVMAKAVAEGMEEAGASVKVVTFDDITPADLNEEQAFALGCSAMGDEELDEGSAEPFVAELEGSVSGKKVVLFGSYDWGDGEWMRNWEERMTKAGAIIVTTVIANNEPDEEAVENCKNAGKELLK